MRRIRPFFGAETGASAAEFAMVLPLLLLFLFGIIDAGRFMWVWNQAEKAAQMGVRYAVVTSMISEGLETHSFIDEAEGIQQGDRVPATRTYEVSCTRTSCTCTGYCEIEGVGTARAEAFDNILNRMRAVIPDLTASNLTVRYNYSGLGYAGDPYAPDAFPVVSVHLAGLSFSPVAMSPFGVTVQVSASSSMTIEDAEGSSSY
jgi:Flp pilus assembly protein TadG